MELYYNCLNQAGKMGYNLGRITSVIYGFQCNSTQQSNRLSFIFNECPFSNIAFRQIVDSIVALTLECFDEKFDPSLHEGIYSKITFTSKTNKINLGWSELEYVAKSFHNVVSFLDNVYQFNIKVAAFFSGEGIIKNYADKMCMSCKNIEVFHSPGSYLYTVKQGAPRYTLPHFKKLYDLTKFYFTASSDGANDPDCIFNNPPKSELTSIEPLNNASISPIACMSVAFSVFIGICLLGQHICKKYLNHENSFNTEDDISLETECLGEYEEA